MAAVRARLRILVLLVACVGGLPLLGAWLAGRPVGELLHFPPRPPEGPGASVTPWAVALVSLGLAAVVGPFVARVVRSRAGAAPAPRAPLASFPWWGGLGLAILAVAWPLAWSRLPALRPLQAHTFAPLWLGYILVVNAWSVRRSGRSLLSDRPRFYAALFPLSAAFWWAFEYLNVFLGNWRYAGGGVEGPLAYVLAATPPFATVLPAVLATAHLLSTFPRLSAGLDAAWRWPFLVRPGFAAASVVAGAAALLALPAAPDVLYPLVWIAPLVLLSGLQVLAGFPTPMARPARGDWREAWLLALAGLVCGLFWELWNAGSLAHWEYAIPHLHVLELFEMPILGYAGYVPFGILCGSVAALATRWRRAGDPVFAPAPDAAPTAGAEPPAASTPGVLA